jgi:hypothetical protein
VRIQSLVHGLEEGPARILVRLAPLAIGVAVILLFYDFSVYRGLDDPQSMDNAQLARQIARGAGFTTQFIRPYALGQLSTHAAARAVLTGSPPELFPAAAFPAGAPRILPDTYNAPGYPSLLAEWFKLLHPSLDEGYKASEARRMYAGDRPIPWLNQIFLLLTAGLVFVLGLRLFDERVAWLALLAFLGTDLVWQYSITALSTSFLMFLVTGAFLACGEIHAVAERRQEDAAAPMWPAWIWVAVLAVLLGCACLTRLHLLILLLPVGLFLGFASRRNVVFIPLLVVAVVAMVVPWFWHMNTVSGSPLGSNAPLLHYGVDEFVGNRIYCTLEAPNYERLFRDASGKESLGFSWHLTHAWELLGTSPLVILFTASLLHHFRRRRAQLFRSLLVSSAFFLVAANNLGVATPAALDAWNVVFLLFPGLLVVGAAFFFILLDRLDVEARFLNTFIAVVLLAITAAPLAWSIFRGGGNFNYPPYAPVYLRFLAQTVSRDQWITSDMPWATAWYCDRGSLWLPDTIKDFERIHDEFCPTRLLVFTPITLEGPLNGVIVGEEKEWLRLVVSSSAPAEFPLPERVNVQGLEYVIWTSPGG